MKSPKVFPANLIRTAEIRDTAAREAIERLVKELEAIYRYLRGDLVEINLGKDGALYLGKRNEQGVWEENTMRMVRVSGNTVVQRLESNTWVSKWTM